MYPTVDIALHGDGVAVTVGGLAVSVHPTYGAAFRQIAWMRREAGEDFPCGEHEEPVSAWLSRLEKQRIIGASDR